MGNLQDALAAAVAENNGTTPHRGGHPLPVGELLYIGEKTKNKLWRKSIDTIGDLVRIGPEYLHDWFGKVGLEHYIRATGNDVSPIVSEDGGPPMRTIGHGSTTPRECDLTSEFEAHCMAHVLASSVCRRMRAHKVVPQTVGVFVSYAKDGDLHYESFQAPMPIPSNIDSEFADAALRLLHKRFNLRHPIRKLGLCGKDLSFNTSVYQLSFELDAMRREKLMDIAHCADEINGRWKHALRRCVELADPRLTMLGSKSSQQFAPAGWF